MITHDWAHRFASQWAADWNNHDIDAVLSHYTDDFEMSSPFILRFTDGAEGTLKGKAEIGNYWRAAMQRIPDLHFEVIQVFAGVDSITLYYNAVLGLQATETFFINEEGLVYKALAAYNRLRE